MGRNDLCFCMSGKKKKVCHPDIHEESQAAAVKPEYPNIYHLYQHFIVKKLGVSIVDFDEKFKRQRNTYGSKL